MLALNLNLSSRRVLHIKCIATTLTLIRCFRGKSWLFFQQVRANCFTDTKSRPELGFCLALTLTVTVTRYAPMSRNVRDLCFHVDSGKTQRDFLLSCLKNRRVLEAHMDAKNMHLDPDELVVTKRTFVLFLRDSGSRYCGKNATTRDVHINVVSLVL